MLRSTATPTTTVRRSTPRTPPSSLSGCRTTEILSATGISGSVGCESVRGGLIAAPVTLHTRESLKGRAAMSRTRWAKAVSCAALFAAPILLGGQKAPNAADVRGTWQVVSSKNLKTGEVTARDGTEWMQLTKSHFTVVGMDNGRPEVSEAKY